ncbi:MAG: DHH family phosphoesterase, partial [Thermodesulfobacteriota bacterium]
MDRRWRVRQPDPLAVRRICRELGIHPAVAAALINRRVEDPAAVGRFLSPSAAELPNPFAMKDMDRAVERILMAVSRREKILVFGDYDADGVTATAVLLEFLRDMNADCDYYIPHRVSEGYGFSVSQAAMFPSYGVVVTVDCGISSHEAVAAAKRMGLDVVVTDHHTPEGSLPEACAVVNPKRPDCTSGYINLAGVGVAFFLCMAIRAEARKRGMFANSPEPNLKKLLDLVAIGTIADMVKLTGENRILAATGLSVLRQGRRPGLFALMEAAGISPEEADSQA